MAYLLFSVFFKYLLTPSPESIRLKSDALRGFLSSLCFVSHLVVCGLTSPISNTGVFFTHKYPILLYLSIPYSVLKVSRNPPYKRGASPPFCRVLLYSEIVLNQLLNL